MRDGDVARRADGGEGLEEDGQFGGWRGEGDVDRVQAQGPDRGVVHHGGKGVSDGVAEDDEQPGASADLHAVLP